ncbi:MULTISPECIES: DMT family transporter [unclassified Oceanispirochaeta]|uniref:DMT family transporter n=1 Tax=unclassified Oceanispirochaeta TaxID=2635722 RepID=UPI001313F228|nr:MULTISPECIES: DMT family transporter [unclassified Oceanispirochaeta]MBF9016251.1 DMT family transporter [Oceanispirochaeta sp. M2]NPD72713.1 DMT family transporter [Oceanispirochaeta sp. M1]
MKSANSRLLAVFACLLWSTAFLGVKIGLRSMPPMLFAGIRFFLAGLAVALLYRKPGKLRQIREHWRQLLLVGMFQTFGLYSLFFYSLTLMRASTGAIVNGVGPLIVAVTAHFTLAGSRLNRRQFFCLILGAAGVVLVSFAGSSDLLSGAASELKAVLIMLAALVFGAMASVLVAKSPDDLDPFLLNAGQLMAGGAALLLTAVLKGDRPYADIPVQEFSLALVWLIFVSAAGFSIWYYLLKVRKESLSQMAVWKFLIPIAGAVISWVFMKDDNPELLSISGMLLTALSIYLFYHTPATTVETEVVREND